MHHCNDDTVTISDKIAVSSCGVVKKAWLAMKGCRKLAGGSILWRKPYAELAGWKLVLKRTAAEETDIRKTPVCLRHSTRAAD